MNRQKPLLFQPHSLIIITFYLILYKKLRIHEKIATRDLDKSIFLIKPILNNLFKSKILNTYICFHKFSLTISQLILVKFQKRKELIIFCINLVTALSTKYAYTINSKIQNFLAVREEIFCCYGIRRFCKLLSYFIVHLIAL